MSWWKNDNQKMADRRRKIRMKRISGEREREFSLRSKLTTPSGMIRVTRLNDEVLYLNIFQIECMESIPETKIKMMNGYYFLVKDSADSVIEQMKTFFRSCFVSNDGNKGE